MFQVEISDGNNPKIKSSETKETVMSFVAQQVVDKIQRGDRRPVILCSSTGSQKSTQFLYNLHMLLPHFTIICSQITVTNTMEIANYMGTKAGLVMGQNLGYMTSLGKVGLAQQSGITYQTIKTVTNNTLLPIIDKKDMNINLQSLLIVIDEAHSQDINCQEILALVQYITETESICPFFIVQSASINPKQFGEYLNTDYIVDVQGSGNIIHQFYLDDLNLQREGINYISKCATDATKLILERQNQLMNSTLQQIKATAEGSILIFVPKVKELRQIAESIEQLQVVKEKKVPVLQLSAVALEKDPQIIKRMMSPGQKVIVSTSIIETGFTIPDLSYVIDSLKFKTVYFEPVKKLEISRDLPICKSMQQQRMGRVGRTLPGIYIGMCTRDIANQLMERREYQIQVNDLKQIVSSIGTERFLQMKFIGKIPNELLVDVMQYQLFFGLKLQEALQYDIFKTVITGDQFKFRPYYRFFILQSLIHGLLLADVLLLVTFFENSLGFKFFPKRFKKVNDFVQILQYVKSQPPWMLPAKFTQMFNELSQSFNTMSLNLYKGIDINKQSHDLLVQVMSRSFQQYILKHVKDNLFRTNYGLTIPIQGLGDKVPKLLITNKLHDDMMGIQPQFLIECNESHVFDTISLCQKK